MDAKYITWNFANFISVNLMVAVLCGIVMLIMRSRTANGSQQTKR